MVNRLWGIFFGRGLVEPVDAMDNPAWSQDLLDLLAVDLVQHGYNLKHLDAIPHLTSLPTRVGLARAGCG